MKFVCACYIVSRSSLTVSETVFFSRGIRPALNFAALLRQYIRQFLRNDAEISLQYLACVCLSSDQGEAGKEQKEQALDEVRKIIVSANQVDWNMLVGGLRMDGIKIVSCSDPVTVIFCSI